MITLGFTVVFSTFLFSWVDWTALLECKDEHTCHPFLHYVSNPMERPTLWSVMVFIWFCLFSVYWLWTVLSFGTQARDAMGMHRFFQHRLGISQRDLQTIEWHEVVARLVALQESGKYRIAINKAGLTAQDIACRIMRKENYLIALINKRVLPLHLPVPNLPCLIAAGDGTSDAAATHATNGGEGGGGSGDGDGGGHEGEREGVTEDLAADTLKRTRWWRLSRRRYLTKTLEWSLYFCVLNHMLNEKFTIRRRFLDDAEALRKRFITLGVLHIVLMPFVLTFMVIHFFLKNAQEWHSKKNYLGPRQWDPVALWQFREFNELPHIFERRLNLSYEHADRFVKRFHRPAVSVIARCLSFISGAFVGVLLILTLLDDSYMFWITLYDRNLLWYLGIFSTIFAVTRSLVPAPLESNLDGDELMARVAEHSHYFPDSWRGKCNTHAVRDQFFSIFKFKVQLFCDEILVVLLAPFVLCVSMPAAAEDMLRFIREHTVDVEGIGSVCGYSLFDFGRYGDERYAAPKDGSEVDGRTEQGKVRRRRRRSRPQTHPLTHPLTHPQTHPTTRPTVLPPHHCPTTLHPNYLLTPPSPPRALHHGVNRIVDGKVVPKLQNQPPGLGLRGAGQHLHRKDLRLSRAAARGTRNATTGAAGRLPPKPLGHAVPTWGVRDHPRGSRGQSGDAAEAAGERRRRRRRRASRQRRWGGRRRGCDWRR